MYLLDTNFLSELRRRSRPAVKWFEPVETDELFVSVMTLGEIAKGAELKAVRDRATAAVLTDWLSAIRRRFARGILPISDEVALEWGRLEAQRPRGPDGLIAATAIVHGLTLVTRNSADFRDIPIALINPWTAS